MLRIQRLHPLKGSISCNMSDRGEKTWLGCGSFSNRLLHIIVYDASLLLARGHQRGEVGCVWAASIRIYGTNSRCNSRVWVLLVMVC